MVFLDESKSGKYTVVASVLAANDVSATRRAVSGLRLKGQNRVHFVKESDSRRRSILSMFCDLPLRAFVYEADCRSDAGCGVRRGILRR